MHKDSNFNLIFDFDGTLADSFYTIIQEFSLIAGKFNAPQINQAEIDKLKDLSSRELIKHLNIPIYKLPGVLRKARESVEGNIDALPIFAGIPEVLMKLHQLNCTLGILTSNSLENVHLWLKRHKIHHLFNFIYAESTYFGKKSLLRKIVKERQLALSNTFYIGDETRDIEAAQKACINSMAVSWGFNSEAALARYNPGYLAKTPNDILTFVKESMYENAKTSDK